MINVIGHLTPDSDSVCSAYVTAHWLNLQGKTTQAWCAGEPNHETRFIFETAGLSVPEVLTTSLAGKDVWLVDFTEPAQGVPSLPESNIIGIIDHHRLGGLMTALPLEVTVKPVGCSSTVLWQLMSADIRKQLTSAEAILMLGAILSDTLALRSPTTTDDDKKAVDDLFEIANIDRDAFIKDLMIAKTSIDGLSARELLTKDIKQFDINGRKVCVDQLELFSLSQIEPVLADLRKDMDAYVDEQGVDLVVLMLTDIDSERSQLYFAGAAKACEEETVIIDGMLSRKKQMLPWLQENVK